MNPSKRGLRVGSALGALLLFAALATSALAAQILSVGGPFAGTSAKKRATQSFKVSGSVRTKLRPGLSSERMNLRLTNHRGFHILVTQLRIAITIDAKHGKAGCRASRDFRVYQLGPKQIRKIASIPPRRARTLRQLGIKTLPRIAMRNLETNQDACKGAKLKLTYSGKSKRGKRLVGH